MTSLYINKVYQKAACPPMFYLTCLQLAFFLNKSKREKMARFEVRYNPYYSKNLVGKELKGTILDILLTFKSPLLSFKLLYIFLCHHTGFLYTHCAVKFLFKFMLIPGPYNTQNCYFAIIITSNFLPWYCNIYYANLEIGAQHDEVICSRYAVSK